LRAPRPLLLAVSIAVLAGQARAARAQMEQPLPPPPGPKPAAPKLTKPPQILKTVEPAYPPEALGERLSADVTMTVDIGADGRVTKVDVPRPVGHGFDEAARAAVMQYLFSPAEVDGKPSPIRIEFTLHFVPKVVPVEAPLDGGAPDALADGGAPADAAAAPEATTQAAPPAPPARVVVRGRLKEKGTREPIVAADVAVILRAEGAAPGAGKAEVVSATDDQGAYEVRAAAPHGLRVILSDSMHEPCIRDFTAAELSGAVPAEWTCSARTRRNTVYETRVRGAAVHPEETKQTLSKVELTTVPGTLGDPLRVVQSLPGVARAPYGLGVLIVRGANPNDTGAFVDTVGVPHLYHFLVGPSVIAANLVEKLDFYPGGFGARYGRFSGGLVDVTLRDEVGKQLHGAVDINVLDSSAYVEGPVGGGVRASASVRRSYIDALLPLFIPDKVGSSFVTVVPVYYDYQARAEKDLRHGRLVIEAFGADDRLNVIAQDPARTVNFDQHSGSHRLLVQWATTAGGWVSKFRPAYGYGVDSFAFGTNTGSIAYHRLFLREDLTRTFGPRFTLAAGLDGLLSYDLADFDVPFPRDGRSIGVSTPQSTRVARRLYDTAPAVYVEAQLAPTPSVRVTPGLRFDYYHVVDVDKFSLDPRLSARWAVTPRLAFKGTAGLYHQLPMGQFLDAQFGNPNLKLIWADQYEVGAERRFTDDINLSVTGFFVRRHDMPIPSIDHFTSAGRGRAYGLELLLRHELTEHFYGWLAYTLSKSEISGTPAEGIPMGMTGDARNGGDLSWRPGPFDQTHNLIAVASYSRRGWTAGARYRFVTGIPTTPVNGSFFDADFNGYTRLNGGSGSARLPNFSQLDLRVERVWTFDAWTFGAYLDCQNVFNAENPEGVLYDYRYQQSAAIRGLTILPILGIRGRF
jgi:TonB family protein